MHGAFRVGVEFGKAADIFRYVIANLVIICAPHGEVAGWTVDLEIRVRNSGVLSNGAGPPMLRTSRRPRQGRLGTLKTLS